MRKIFTDLDLDELSNVDVPAQEGAKAHVVKRDFSAEDRKKMADNGQALADGSFPIATVADLQNAIRAIGRAKDEAAAKAHIITRARALGATDQLPDSWEVKKSGTQDEGTTMKIIAKMLNLPETATEGEIAAALQKRDETALAETKKRDDKLAEIEKTLADQKTFSDMSDAERAYHGTLKAKDAKEAETFLKMTPDEKKKKMQDDNDADDTMKMADGTTVRKSVVGAVAFTVMKTQQEALNTQAEQIKKLADAAETETFRADVAKNFAHVAGTEGEKIELLKAMSRLPETARKAQRAIMDSAEKLAKAAFDTVGLNGGPEPGSPDDEVEKRSQELAKAKGIPIAKARIEFSETSDYQDIMKRAQN